MNDCLFCSIANGDKSKLVWENEVAAAFYDIQPKAPVHILLVPKQHIATLDDLDDQQLAGQLLQAVRELAGKAEIKGGYRVQVNVGKHGGQVVDHLHIHIMAGKQFAA